MALDEGLDLGFVNYRIHPENKQYYVFRFKDEERANHFETLMIQDKIWFEKDTQEVNDYEMILFAIHKNDYKKVQKMNFDTEAKFRKPFIQSKGLRYLLLIITFGAILLSIFSYMKR